MTLPRVVYLSAPPLGEAMLEWLRTQPCEIIFNNSDFPKGVKAFPWNPLLETSVDCDLGLNLLGEYKIPDWVIEKVPFGWVNFHPAPLPEFGGRNVAYHAINSYAEEFGATVHYMNQDFDTGPIIECRRFPISDGMTAGDLMTTAKGLLVKMFMEWVPKLLQGRVPSVPQTNTRYYKPKEINNFVNLSDLDAIEQIRALTCHPKHHARLMIGGRKYKIVPE